MLVEIKGNGSHDEMSTIALVGGAEVPAGTHDVRIVCRCRSATAYVPAFDNAALTATITH